MAIPGYTATGLDPAGFPNPLAKSVAIGGSWFDNLSAHPYFYLLPALGLLGSLLSVVFGKAGKWGSAIVASSVALLGIVLTPFVTMFPFVMPSSLDPVSSLTLWDCTSSQLTLEIMFFVTLIFLPLVVIYTSWALSRDERQGDPRVHLGKLSQPLLMNPGGAENPQPPPH